MPNAPLTPAEKLAAQNVRGELEHLDPEETRRVLLHVAEQLGISLDPESDFSVGQ